MYYYNNIVALSLSAVLTIISTVNQSKSESDYKLAPGSVSPRKIGQFAEISIKQEILAFVNFMKRVTSRNSPVHDVVCVS